MLGKVWGQRNRLGNSPAVYYYDIWSNLHYGYVGRAAGFSTEELVWFSNAQQKSGTGEVGGEDPARDSESVREGCALYDRRPSGVVLSDVMEIVKEHEPDDYNLNTGWGYLDYNLASKVQTRDGRAIELKK